MLCLANGNIQANAVYFFQQKLRDLRYNLVSVQAFTILGWLSQGYINIDRYVMLINIVTTIYMQYLIWQTASVIVSCHPNGFTAQKIVLPNFPCNHHIVQLLTHTTAHKSFSKLFHSDRLQHYFDTGGKC